MLVTSMLAFATLVRAGTLRVAAIGAGLALAPAAQQRALVAITSSPEDHRDAILSPDGQFIAYRGPSKLSVVPYAGGTEVPVEQANNNIGSFLWAPDSLGLYYLTGVDLKYVQRGGGNPRLVATLPEIGVSLWDVKQDGSSLFGTWVYVRNNGGQAIWETHIFTIASDGSAPPQVLVTSILSIDGVQISPDATKIVYREYSATPFTPRDYMVANIDGSSPVSLTGGTGLNLDAGMPVWRPDGSGVYVARIDRGIARPVIEQLLLTSTTPVRLTFPNPARNLSLSHDGQWVVYEGYWPALASWTVMAMPADGGGHIALDPSRPLVFTGTPQLGGFGGDRVVVSGTLAAAQNAQVYRVELARELRVFPRAVTGGQVAVELPAAAGEIGTVFLAAAPGGPIAVPGLAGAFALDPAVLVTVLSGVGSGQGPISAQLPIPNVASLRRQPLYLQGLRLTSLAPTGDFSRMVALPIF